METQNVQTAPCNLPWLKHPDFHDPPSITRWRDIHPGIYRLCEIQDCRIGRFSPCLVLSLFNKCCNSFFVYALPHLCFTLKLQLKTQFILNEGVKRSHTGNPLFSFKLL